MHCSSSILWNLIGCQIPIGGLRHRKIPIEKEHPNLRDASADAPSKCSGFKKRTPVDRCQGNLRLPEQLSPWGLFDNWGSLYECYIGPICVISALHRGYMKVIWRKNVLFESYMTGFSSGFPWGGDGYIPFDQAYCKSLSLWNCIVCPAIRISLIAFSRSANSSAVRYSFAMAISLLAISVAPIWIIA